MQKLSCVSEIHTLLPEVGQIRPLQYVVLLSITIFSANFSLLYEYEVSDFDIISRLF